MLNDIISIGLTISQIIQEAVKNELFFRGAISFGDYSRGPNAVIGPTIDDTSICYDKPELIGIVASEAFNNLINYYDKNNYNCYPFIKYDLPLKGSILHNWWLLKWNYDGDDICSKILKSKYENHINNPKVQVKYLNSILINA